jgi:hypothetical protein
MNDWISVEDRLPEDREYVDAWSDFRSTDCEFKRGGFYEVVYDGDGDYEYSEIIDDVTHWMSPPSPPKELK